MITKKSVAKIPTRVRDFGSLLTLVVLLILLTLKRSRMYVKSFNEKINKAVSDFVYSHVGIKFVLFANFSIWVAVVYVVMRGLE